jgi:type VI secretion system protein ImpF
MAAEDNQTGPVLSILDRLTDLQPDSKKEAPSNPWEKTRQLKASLCRDLAALLNTRRAEEDFNSSFAEATNSLLTFGVADFTSYNLKNGIEQERVRRSIERAIRQFEPRLTGVTVSMDEPDAVKPSLHFQISAVLRTELVGEAILLDLTLHRDSRRIAVSGASS